LREKFNGEGVTGVVWEDGKRGANSVRHGNCQELTLGDFRD
jgi:hypothetical protein